jgi:hypothetical protein
MVYDSNLVPTAVVVSVILAVISLPSHPPSHFVHPSPAVLFCYPLHFVILTVTLDSGVLLVALL